MRREIHIAQSPVRYTGLACPVCFATAEGMTMLSSVRRVPIPTPGAVVICTECLAVNIVTDGIGLRRATPAEVNEILGDETLASYMEAAARVRGDNGKRS